MNDALDEAIDRTLRELMQLDPPDGFSAAVMGRIASAESLRSRVGRRADIGRRLVSPKPRMMRAGVRGWQIAAALAVAAAILLAIATTLLVRTRPAQVNQVADTHRVSPPSPAPASPVGSQPQVAPSETGPAQAAMRTTRITPPRRAATNNGSTAVMPPLEPAIEIARLGAPEAIVIRDIAPSEMRVEVLEIRPLDIAPLEVNRR